MRSALEKYSDRQILKMRSAHPSLMERELLFRMEKLLDEADRRKAQDEENDTLREELNMAHDQINELESVVEFYRVD